MPDLVLGSTTVMSESGGEISSTFFGLKSMQSFTSSGTYTKPAHINTIRVFITGSGGGGGGGNPNWNNGGGGGAGGTAIKLIDISNMLELVSKYTSPRYVKRYFDEKRDDNLPQTVKEKLYQIQQLMRNFQNHR